ncbi:amidase signature domain-containing protein, partial [Triangularia setosa]
PNRKPLHGLRFAIKDVFDVKDLRVTAGNRAFYSPSKTAKATCPIFQRLLDAGADHAGVGLFGTLRLGGTHQVSQLPRTTTFNPRGDGYQSAGGGGSGAAIAAYDWLNFTIGTNSE